MPDLARKLVHNTFFNFLGRAVGRLANFFLVPFILHTIGVGDFGLFSLLNVFFYFAGLSDLGTGASLVRFMAADASASNTAGLSKRVGGQLLFCFSITLALAAFLHVARGALLAFFHLGSGDFARMQFLVVPFILAMGLGCMSNVFASVLLGFQRMDITNAIAVLLVIPNVVGTVFLLKAGWGLEGLVLLFFAVQALGFVLCFLAAGAVCPALHWTAYAPDRADFVRTVKLGLHLQWMRVVATLSKTWDQVLLASMVGLSAVTTYALAAKPVLLAQEAGSLLLSATVPVVAHLDMREDARRMDKLLRLSQRYQNLFVGAALIGFFLFSGFFVRIWLGSGYESVAMVMRMLALGHLIPLLMSPGINELVGRGDLRLLTPILAVQAALQIVLTWLAIKFFGLMGPAAALAVASACGTTHFLIAFYRKKGVRPLPEVIQSVTL